MLVNPLWTLFHVGDDKTGIVSGVFVGGADDLGFDDDAAQAWPLPGLVADFPVNMFGLSAAPRQLARSSHSGFGDRASTPHSWPSRQHIRVWAGHPET